MEVREELNKYKFPGDDLPIVFGSALKALEAPDSDHPDAKCVLDLVEQLDTRELEGLLAHELAHIARRDVPLNVAIGVIRDLTFFVPPLHLAARWLRQEQEHAADDLIERQIEGWTVVVDPLLLDDEIGPAALTALANHLQRVRYILDPEKVAELRELRLWVDLSNFGWLDNPNMEIGIVANRVKANTKFLATFDAFIQRMNIPRVATLRDTQNYIRALDAGLSLFDLPPGRVAADLAQWQPLMEWSGLFEMEDEELLALFAMEGLAEAASGGAFDGAKCDLQCSTGYDVAGTTRSLQCTANGTWTPPEAELAKCVGKYDRRTSTHSSPLLIRSSPPPSPCVVSMAVSLLL